MTVTKHRTCATCGGRAVPIVYGMASVDAFDAENSGELVIGGCVIVEGESPGWKCASPSCGLEFGQLPRD